MASKKKKVVALVQDEKRRSAEGWYAFFGEQALSERQEGQVSALDPDTLVRAVRSVCSAVRLRPKLAGPLADEDAGEGYFKAFLRRADELNALRSQAPGKLNAWPVLSAEDKAQVRRVVAWLRSRIKRVRRAAKALRSPKSAADFGPLPQPDRSAQVLIKALRSFRTAAAANPALVAKARLKPEDSAQLGEFEAALEAIGATKDGTQAHRGDLREQMKVHALALDDQLRDYEVRAMAAFDENPSLLKVALEPVPSLSPRRKRAKAKAEADAAEEADAKEADLAKPAGASGK